MWDDAWGHRTLLRLAASAAALAAVAGLAACGNDGRDLAEPRPDQTTTTTAAGESSSEGVGIGTGQGDGQSTGQGAGQGAAGQGQAEALTLTSPAFANGGEIPVDHTCRGANRSPALQWTGIPGGTAEIAVVVRDIDFANGFVHWVITGIPPNQGGIADNTPPAGAVQATNSIGGLGYGGPCPPSGTHTYEFRVYALSQPSGVTEGEAGAEAASKVEATPALGSALLSGTASAS
jgi:Raf kinase inhibitor-like YbhB/YbcL family protein